jgi:tetratricopeptide (TPR) repeat protein
LRLKPGNDKAVENRAETRYHLQDWKGSVADFEKLIAAGRSDVEFYQKIGVAKYTLKDYKGAAEALENVVQKRVRDKEVFKCWD